MKLKQIITMCALAAAVLGSGSLYAQDNGGNGGNGGNGDRTVPVVLVDPEVRAADAVSEWTRRRCSK